MAIRAGILGYEKDGKITQEITEIQATWDALPEAVKAGILAMIRASKK